MFFRKMCYNSAMDEMILKFFEGIRSPALNVVFGIFSTLGEGMVVAGIVILLYWLWGKAGEQLLFTAVSSAALNSVLKVTVARPRPFVAGVVERVDIDTPIFSTRDLGDFLSFPSGHAQTSSAALVGSSLRLKKWWMWLIAVPVILLIICSRLYFGVHYPTDLLAGLALGIAVAVFWEIIFRYAYKSRHLIMLFFAAAVICLVPFFPEKDLLMTGGLLAGAAVFMPLTSLLKYDPPKWSWKRLWRIPVGGILAGMVYVGFHFLPADTGLYFLRWFLLVGAATFVANAFFKLLKI